MIIESRFQPAWWLKNPHAQTMYSSLLRRTHLHVDASERIELPDGDFIDLAFIHAGLEATSPLVIFLHGLGGNIHSTYVAGQVQAYLKRGWRTAFMHFRGASAEPNRLARAYHSGDTDDLRYILQVLQEREPKTPKALVGISLGGNVALKFLGECPEQTMVQTAAAVSVPFELHGVATRINQGFSRVYQQYLLNKMKKMFQRKQLSYPALCKEQCLLLENIDTFYRFDDQITAPLHGFQDALDYYRRASSRQYLKNISIPTLVIHAMDDPFMTPAVIPTAAELSPTVSLELSTHGGHVGFISGNMPGKPYYWLEQRIPDYLNDFL